MSVVMMENIMTYDRWSIFPRHSLYRLILSALS